MGVEKREALEEKRAAADELAHAMHQHEKRLTCIYDGVLQGMLNDLDDAVPFCSSYIGITNVQATNTLTTKT